MSSFQDNVSLIDPVQMVFYYTDLVIANTRIHPHDMPIGRHVYTRCTFLNSPVYMMNEAETGVVLQFDSCQFTGTNYYGVIFEVVQQPHQPQQPPLPPHRAEARPRRNKAIGFRPRPPPPPRSHHRRR